MERKGIITFGGSPCVLEGNPVNVGDDAPNFTVLANDLSDRTIDSYKGKILLISVVPSLDTGVCDLQTRRFNQEAAALGKNVQILTISCDLPFAQERWCGAADVNQLETLSDYKDLSFGKNYGLIIKEWKLLTRAVIVIDTNKKVKYIEIVPEVTNEVNFEEPLKVIKSLI